MVAGHLQEKKGMFYIVLSYKGSDNQRKTKWLPTGLTVKGNKKRAEAMLMEARKTFIPETAPATAAITQDTLFSDFLTKWLAVVKSSIKPATYSSYSGMLDGVILPYFRHKWITLTELQASDIQEFYTAQLERVSANTVIHYHAIIHKALKYAVKMDLLPANPADKVERPKKDRYVASFYDSDEINQLFAIVKDTPLELPVMLAAFYGLRRSEVVGLKWDAIDFAANTITIKHTVASCVIDGKRMEIASDTTKTKSSMRTLPLVPLFREMLLQLHEEQGINRRLCGRSYCTDFLGYICVNEIGERVKPAYLTSALPKMLKKHNMRVIRFHDLRHTCASLLLANGVSMKQIQEWLGHSDFSTTANIYAHLDYHSKLMSADAMLAGLGIGTDGAEKDQVA
ncbi:MAG: site-specific integrase [Christensenellaceae bacterium]|nr:site-specific integrase [Christensenellaceae bacterium]